MASKKLEDQSKEELIEYISSRLRPEMKARREDTERYDAAFGNLNANEKRGMLHMISQFTTNRKAGAELFRELADSVLGQTTTKQTEEDPDPEQETDMSDENSNEEAPAWAMALMAKVEALEAGTKQQYEMSEAQEIAAIKAEAREFGLEEGTDEWVNFFQIAGSDIADGDLDKAFDIFAKLYDIELEDDGEEYDDVAGDEAGEGDAEGVEESSPPAFPKTGGAGGQGAPNSSIAEEDTPDLSKQGVSAAAREFFENAASDNSGTP